MTAMIVQCRACSKEVSKTAKTCPHCGDRDPAGQPEVSWPLRITGLLFILLLIWILG
jgi:anaerobic ribonucleoside-triphosphate reductase